MLKMVKWERKLIKSLVPVVVELVVVVVEVVDVDVVEVVVEALVEVVTIIVEIVVVVVTVKKICRIIKWRSNDTIEDLQQSSNYFLYRIFSSELAPSYLYVVFFHFSRTLFSSQTLTIFAIFYSTKVSFVSMIFRYLSEMLSLMLKIEVFIFAHKDAKHFGSGHRIK